MVLLLLALLITSRSIHIAEQTLTKDTVPVNVDAVVYWAVGGLVSLAKGNEPDGTLPMD